MWRQLYKTGIGLTTGFIGSHTVTHNYSIYTTESLQGPGPPADPTGSHWPSNNSSGLFSGTHLQLTRNCY
jgi:hypothetical protein